MHLLGCVTHGYRQLGCDAALDGVAALWAHDGLSTQGRPCTGGWDGHTSKARPAGVLHGPLQLKLRLAPRHLARKSAMQCWESI